MKSHMFVSSDNVYLKKLQVGTMEVILAEFRFKNAKVAAQAKSVDLGAHALMSDYMKEIKRRGLEPKRTAVRSRS